MKTEAQVGSVNYNWSASFVPPPPYIPNPQFPDANPYGVLAQPGLTYVVDSGSNTLDSVKANGTVNVLAWFPDTDLGPIFLADAVPTCVAKGPDGALYVGTLGLVQSIVFSSPQALVYRIDPSTLGNGLKILGPSDVYASNLWPINGCAFGPDGTLYASELFTAAGNLFNSGDVVALRFNAPNNPISLTGGTLPLPAGVAVSSNGTVYAVGVTAFAPPNSGIVVRLTNK
jgi:hypothetical protein